MQVEKSTQETVYPVEPSPGGVIELSNNDQIMPRLYTSLLFFFREKPADEASSFLKSSLAETLSLFYPAAGRYRERANGGLEILCNDAGASFYEAWVDCGFDSFSPNFDPHPDFALLAPPLDASADVSQIPLLSAQITHFECGRICLGVRLHHNVCDGFSTGHFLSSWAILASGKMYRDPKRDDSRLIIQPCLDRSLLRANNLPSPTADHPEYQTHMPNLPTTWPPATSKVFPFTPSCIDDLRARVTSGLTPSHSRFEALAAHLWRGIIYARGLASDQEVRLGMAVDGRKRFDPALPEGYFGNVNFYGYTTCKAGELVESPLSFAADLVKSAIAKVDDAHMRSALDWVAKQESPKSVIAAFCTPFIDLAVTSWSRFPFYELDFGWGKPASVRIPVSAFDGLIILLPSPLGAGHVDALVGLSIDKMPKFEDYVSNVD
ncbi:hypothetical protein GOP47_0024540 [Adiantum capillus-veneris]|uniref:Uncharacterized protein n=1 Tax=Adiantum capillus-veneris TaxID=13818 RepID=A0A9D4U368_ADICA|nr:hypothetical protein GOP47_0024540 [Adiantum capillus-veneris]